AGRSLKSSRKLRCKPWRFRHAGEALDQIRHGAAAVGPDHAHIRIAVLCAAKNHLRNRTSSVRLPFDGAVADALDQVLAAIRGDGMSEDNGFAAFEFFENWIEVRVAKPFVAIVCVHADAVDLERV